MYYVLNRNIINVEPMLLRCHYFSWLLYFLQSVVTIMSAVTDGPVKVNALQTRTGCLFIAGRLAKFVMIPIQHRSRLQNHLQNQHQTQLQNLPLDLLLTRHLPLNHDQLPVQV